MMKSEMEVMKLDERERLCWLYANRATLFFVGLVWIGLAVRQLLLDSTPYFLLVMIPVFALARFGFFRLYKSRG
jgi:hypothetical protein